jgi:hypothetical protein
MLRFGIHKDPGSFNQNSDGRRSRETGEAAFRNSLTLPRLKICERPRNILCSAGLSRLKGGCGQEWPPHTSLSRVCDPVLLERDSMQTSAELHPTKDGNSEATIAQI